MSEITALGRDGGGGKARGRKTFQREDRRSMPSTPPRSLKIRFSLILLSELQANVWTVMFTEKMKIVSEVTELVRAGARVHATIAQLCTDVNLRRSAQVP